MRTGPVLVGAAIGGAVWILALRTTGKAVAPSMSPEPPTPGVPDGQVRDGQGNIIGAPTEGPLTSPAAGTDDMASAAKAAKDTTTAPLQADAAIAGVDGGTGANLPMRVIGETGTVAVDHNAPLGGQGTDQMSSAVRIQNTDPTPPPAYASGSAQYEDYLVAASGSVEGMTPRQIAELIREGAQIGGLSL